MNPPDLDPTDELDEDDLDELEELESGYCFACETNPVRLERALELAEELPQRWRTIAGNFGPDSVTHKLLEACAKELADALAARSNPRIENAREQAGGGS